MKESLTPSDLPEFVFGLAGPLGVDLNKVEDSLRDALVSVGYDSLTIKLTDENKVYNSGVKQDGSDFFSMMRYKMNHANRLCDLADDPAFHARLAIMSIKIRRSTLIEARGRGPKGIAYIIRQMKRPAEIELLRKVYGEQFVLISAYTSITNRKALIAENLRRTLPPRTKESAIEQKLNELIEIDEDEGIGATGQKLREVFQLGDVFIDGSTRPAMHEKLSRFVNVLFGDCTISPNKDEVGMYTAKSAAFRSIDLSRQVGAAILTSEGEIISHACNEVPKAFGGTYWDGEQPDYRDMFIGYDPNELETKEVLRDLFQRLSDAKFLSNKAKELGSPTEMVEALVKRAPSTLNSDGILAASAIRDITEYGRVVHAEMNAICEAARLGRSVKNATLFCTTFPCHNCTKHIIAAGIVRVVYIEPYPKSKAKLLHSNEIEFDGTNDKKVSFVPFLGISPSRYKEVFSKGRRKTPDGQAIRWLFERPKPMVDYLYPTYLQLETIALAPILSKNTTSNIKSEPISSGDKTVGAKKRSVAGKKPKL